MDKIEIPFGAYDSETLGWTYTIPKGYTAKIEDGKIIVKKEELEDEKIKKSLVKFLKSLPIKHRCEYAASELENWLTWLEKQKEQKPAEWVLPGDFEEAVYKVANFISPFDNQEELRKTSHRFAEQLFSLAKKELDRAAEWSEEDEEMIKMILGDLEWGRRNTTVNKDIKLYDEKIAWLKAIRPQPHWKPSEEQMKQLYYAITPGSTFDCNILYDLYRQLKKLGVKEEPEYYQHFDSDC